MTRRLNSGVTLEGAPRTLRPAVWDDTYRIASEAVTNAFRHANARLVEVEIRYDARLLRLRVRDDGVGVDRTLLAEGARQGHWGLPGMRERARSLGGRLELWSEHASAPRSSCSFPR